MEVKARNVILAAGGFEANAELRARHLGQGWEKAKVSMTPFVLLSLPAKVGQRNTLQHRRWIYPCQRGRGKDARGLGRLS